MAKQKGDSKAEKVRSGGKKVAVAGVQITEAGREGLAAEGLIDSGGHDRPVSAARQSPIDDSDMLRMWDS